MLGWGNPSVMGDSQGLARILDDINMYRSRNNSRQGFNGNNLESQGNKPTVPVPRRNNWTFESSNGRNEIGGSRNDGYLLERANHNNSGNMDPLTETLRNTRLPHGPQVLQHLDSEIASLRAQLVRSSDAASLDGPEHHRLSNVMHGNSQHKGNGSGENENATSSSSSGVDCQEGAVSMISFTSSMECSGVKTSGDSKADVAASFLSSLSSSDSPADMIQTMQVLSKDPSMADIMKNSGCILHLIHFLHPGDVWLQPPKKNDVDNMTRAAEILFNILKHQSMECRKGMELKVLVNLDHIRAYSLNLRMVYTGIAAEQFRISDIRQIVVDLTRSSFNEESREITRFLGGTQALCELLVGIQLVYPQSTTGEIVEIRKLIGMALTNLTFGDDESKKVLCRFPRFLATVNAQIGSPTKELRQVFASVIRNLSWKADAESKTQLRESGTVGGLVGAGMEAVEEGMLKSILSALWNLSFHSAENKEEICQIPGALPFLIGTLKFRSSGQRGLELVENGSGILRNISNHIALSEDYRSVLRRHDCFRLLVGHLSSSSLTIVANSCGTLWNLSARCPEDQKTLWELGAEPRLRSLTYSKHKNIAMGATNALKNLWSSKPSAELGPGNGAAGLMGQRKMKALESELMESAELTSSMERSGRSRRTPSKAVVEMMGELVSPVPWNPERPAKKMLSSASSNSLQRSTKEEIMEQDKAAVQRFHNSLRRSRKLSPEAPKSFCVERTPMMSQAGSETDLTKIAPASPEKVTNYACEGTPLPGASKQPSPSLAPKGKKETHDSSQGTPLMFSRQSSIESLESCGVGADISNIPSVYSTRCPTGIVTPSDLPDSPGRLSPTAPPPNSSSADESGPKVLHHSPGKLSTGSSLSALTIDDEIKVKPSRPKAEWNSEEDPEYATFFRREDHSDLLERSIKSVLPDPSFKSPKGSPPKRTGRRNFEANPTGSLPLLKNSRSKPEFPTSSAWNRENQEPEDPAIALMEEAIHAAMPKQKKAGKAVVVPNGISPRHMGKNVAIAKPMRRCSAGAKEEEEEVRKFACEGTPGNPSRSSSAERPKLPPMSAESSPRRLPLIGSPARAKKTHFRPLEGEKGILEASGLSMLVDSHNSSFLVSSGISTGLEDIQPPEELMLISGISSCSFMRHSGTAEKVRDASHLLNRKETRTQASGTEKQQSDGAESLSEDNYSPLEDDENFDIAPEDIDLSLVSEDAHRMVQRLENAADLMDGELLIECETYSLVSNDSKVSDNASSAIDPASDPPRPRITIPTAKEEPKTIRGGAKKSKTKIAAGPKVRTTKTAQLRAKKAADETNNLLTPPKTASPHFSNESTTSSRKSSEAGSSTRSSASKSEPRKTTTTTAKTRLNSKFLSPKPARDTESSDGSSTSPLTVANRVKKSTAPPPVPPKPKWGRKERTVPEKPPTPKPSPNNNQTQQDTARKEAPTAVVKGSSKRMLVTTV